LLLGLQKDAPSITRVRHHSQCLEAVLWPPRRELSLFCFK
jgi:hypothetical protein